jgi:hypothetical protein
MHFAYQNFYVHSALLFFVFCACTWYGATFYFEVRTPSHDTHMTRHTTRTRRGRTHGIEA